MELEEIKEIARKEKGRDLRPIANDFYEQAGAYVRSLEKEMIAIGRPRSPEYKMIEDQLTSTVSDIETIFMRRVGKVVDRATSNAFSSAGTGLLRKDFDKLLPAERDLYETVYRAILDSRKILAAGILDGDAHDGDHGGPGCGNDGTGSKPDAKEDAASQRNGGSENKIMGKGIGSLDDLTRKSTGSGPAPRTRQGSSAAPPSASPSPAAPPSAASPSTAAKADDGNSVIYHDRIVVRILSDIPEFRGEDKRNYRVRAQDVVTLPAANAAILVKRQAARLITGSFGA